MQNCRKRLSPRCPMLEALLFLGFLITGAVGDSQAEDNYVTFFYSSDFDDSADVYNFTPGCHDLSTYFGGSTASLNTSDNCITVFSKAECAGDSHEFRGVLNDLESWSNKIKSWKPCSGTEARLLAPQDGRVAFFWVENFRGSRRIEPFSRRCHDLPDFLSATTESLSTGGNCVRVYADQGCASKENEKFVGIHRDLGSWKNKVKSWEGCSLPIPPLQTIPRERRISFFYESDFEGPEDMANYTEGCHDLASGLSGQVKSINTYGKCVRIYSEPGCVGQRTLSYSNSDFEDFPLQLVPTIKSWETCTYNFIERERPPSYGGYIRFFSSKEFQGKVHWEIYSPGCHELPAVFTSNTQSINTHDRCIRVFSESGCKGETKEYFPGSPSHNNLEDWNDKIVSWQACSLQNDTESLEESQHDDYILFFTQKDQHGFAHPAYYMNGTLTCRDIPFNVISNIQSIDTRSKCIRVFSEYNCTGEIKEYYPDSPSLSDIDYWKDKIKSWDACLTPNQTQMTPPLDGKIKFTYLTDFNGNQYIANYTIKGCNELPSGFRRNTQSLDTGGKCIRVFSSVNCQSEKGEFSGVYKDLAAWKDKISSWQSCAVASNDTTSQPGEFVNFYYNTDFTGRVDIDTYNTSGCHDLQSLSADAQSLSTAGNCIRAFVESGCIGRYKEYAGQYSDLEEWKDKIRSWESCSSPVKVGIHKPQYGEVNFFINSDYNGDIHTSSYTSGCHQMPPDFSGNTESLRTDKCIRVFKQVGCTGENNDYLGNFATLGSWNNKIKSWGKCPRVSESLRQHFGGVSFFTLPDFRGSSYMDNYTPECHEMGPYFRAKVQSVDTHDKCITIFSEVECTGESTDISSESSDVRDLQEWNQRMQSWKQCQNSTNDETTQVDQV